MARRLPRTRKPKTLQGVRPNEGLAAAYSTKLESLVDDLHASVLYWLRAAYRKNTPEMAQDASPARELQSVMDRLASRWKGRIAKGAPELGGWFAKSAQDRSDSQLTSILKRAGFAVKFRMTREANDILQATIGEQVGLIKSIGEQHLASVEGIVMRAVAAGGDLKTLTDELTAQYGITRRRATFIAQDQNQRATSTMTRARQLQVGITQCQWRHSRGGKHPRASHIKASDEGLIYDVAEGALIDGKRIWPGSEIGCRCFGRPILPTLSEDED